ncbi:hypothetical protein QUF58_01115 [Anaerolineales bacterium HSG24]|nr:hypothetical protein [Anaerolineales bacterium HSG24]
MDISPTSVLIRNFNTKNLIEYLKLTGWNHTKEDNPRWLVYKGSNDALGEPLEIVLPRNQNASDSNIYISSAINLLSAITDETPEVTVKKVKLYDTDVLDIRNLETGERDSISLQLAAQQIQEVKHLIAYSACSEYDPQPHYKRQLTSAKKMINHYQFGHTKQGSFIFTIESKIIREPTRYAQLRFLPKDEDDMEPRPPLERRVMERVVRGLLTTKQATTEKNIEILVNAYFYGFNSKMCNAITKMTQNQSDAIEYRVMWSPKIKPSLDVMDFESVTLNSADYHYLSKAELALKDVKPEKTTIKGMVKGLDSEGPPLGKEDTQRSVIIKWIERPYRARPVNVQVMLNKNEYTLAHKAHIEWIPIYVTGFLQETVSTRRLGSPENFRLTE